MSNRILKIQNILQTLNSKKLITLIVVWSIAIICGMSSIIGYSNTPGEESFPPNVLLKEAPVSFNDNHYQLLMFIHPKCPCTRSSIRELTRFITSCPENITITFFCFVPSDKSDKNKNWLNTDIVKSAQAIPHSIVISDVNGKWAKSFDAKTSGHVLLYHPDGNLLFSGGITAGRGHEGDNPGRTFITHAVKNKGSKSSQCLVYGCPIVK